MDFGSMTVEVLLAYHNNNNIISYSFLADMQISCWVAIMAKIVSDIKIHTKQWCVIEFLHAEKLYPLTFVDACWMFIKTSSQVVDNVFQQWWQ